MERKVRVLFDHQIFSLQKVGGISRYFVELQKQLPHIGADCLVPDCYNQNLYLSHHEVPSWTNKIPAKFQARVLEYLSRKRTLDLVKTSAFDVFHPTYYSTYHLNKIKRPLVLTVYDMIHEVFPDQFRTGKQLKKDKNKLLERADKIIAISHHTKSDILRFTDVKSEKIDVIHLASSLHELSPRSMNLKFKRFVLFVGTRSGYKNFHQLAESFAKISRSYPDVHLLCIGGGAFTDDETNLFKKLLISDKVVQHNGRDDELVWAYQNCECFVFPSLYEGFGIPILESMSCGAVTILSYKSCFPEIAGNAALYFSTTDELAGHLHSILGRSIDRNAIVSLGKAQASLYSWQKVAQETLNTYRKLL